MKQKTEERKVNSTPFCKIKYVASRQHDECNACTARECGSTVRRNSREHPEDTPISFLLSEKVHAYTWQRGSIQHNATQHRPKEA
jgi:hypothetical protein